MNVNEKIVELRQQNNWTQAEFAAKLQVETELVEAWEKGEVVPSLYQAMDIAKVFDCALDDLFKQEEHEEVEEEKVEEVVPEVKVENKKGRNPFSDAGIVKTFLIMFLIGVAFVALTIGNMDFLVVMLPVILIILYIAVIGWLVYQFIKVRKIRKNKGL